MDAFGWFYDALRRAGLRPEEAERLSRDRAKDKVDRAKDKVDKAQASKDQAAKDLAEISSQMSVVKQRMLEELRRQHGVVSPTWATQRSITASATPMATPGTPHGPHCPCASCISYFGNPGSGPFPMKTTQNLNLPALPPAGATQEMKTDDVEVARYGLRTFNTQSGRLGSVAMSAHWDKGVIEAKCLKESSTSIRITQWGDEVLEYSPTHRAPQENCSCGAYATVDLQSLIKQYAPRARINVAVIAAEGPTIIGAKGMRTSAARVVAFWTPEDALGRQAKTVYERVCDTEPKYYCDIREMLKDFNFPEYKKPLPWEDDYPGYEIDQDITMVAGRRGSSYQVRRDPTTGMVTQVTGSGPMSPEVYNQLVKMMGAQATPEALAVMRKLWGQPEAPKP